MKIVTYNVNGLRPRVAQFGSLRRLLDAFDADVICFQETKLSRHEIRAHLVQAEGYESFFSCTRSSEKGRTGYSGVATFCRVKSPFSSDEVTLPHAAEEGFTGTLMVPKGSGSESPSVLQGLESFSMEDTLKVDSEGRCIMTDHGHFVLFNVYGPRAEHDDLERIQFKRLFFNILQKRCESLLNQGRRLIIVGDLNIAPCSIDRCDAGPDFEENEFRAWFRSILLKNGGRYVDVFRERHPDRRDAYTCWPINSGAEEFNFGSRIDHILCAGPCLHKEKNESHSFMTCHVSECDILDQFKRRKPGDVPRHNVKARNVKLEGSDHAPVYMVLLGIPEVRQHNTPPLSMRYCPQVYGWQQTLVSMFSKRQAAEEIASCGASSLSEDFIDVKMCNNSQDSERHSCSQFSAEVSSKVIFHSSLRSSEESHLKLCSNPPCSEIDQVELALPNSSKKKARKSSSSQLSLKSFFQKTCSPVGNSSSHSSGSEIRPRDLAAPKSDESPSDGSQHDDRRECLSDKDVPILEDTGNPQPSRKEKHKSALVEWQRIQQLMQKSLPLCKGHQEPCVSRVVKKSGPNFGRQFYTCARAEGPACNPEANCGYFKWANGTPGKKKH